MLREVIRDLGDFHHRMVFTGGLVLPLYFERRLTLPVRPTRDADAVVACATYLAWSRLQADLGAIGTRPVADDPEAPICRMRTVGGYLLDLMPTDPGVLGFGNQWFGQGFEQAIEKGLGDGTTIRIFPPPLYFAAKWFIRAVSLDASPLRSHGAGIFLAWSGRKMGSGGLAMCPFLRPLEPSEQQEIERLAHSRTEQARLVERARIIWRLARGVGNESVGCELGVSGETVRLWLRRFNDAGVQGLRDRHRSGGPRTYTLEQASEVVALALTRPGDLGLPFASWTLDRLEAYLNEVKGIAMKRSRIDEVLLKEGLRWREEETWFSKRPDPRFAEKRGRLKGSTRPLQKTASSSV